MVTRVRARQAIPSAELPDRVSPLGVPGQDDGVWAAVAALPERQHLAIAYHYLGGLPHAETADIIGGSAAAVRRAAAEGMKSLRQLYHSDQQTKGAPQ